MLYSWPRAITLASGVAAQASSEREEIIYLDIEREDVFAARRSFPLFRDRRPEVYSVISEPMEYLF
jgi:predicted amidohydrolase